MGWDGVDWDNGDWVRDGAGRGAVERERRHGGGARAVGLQLGAAKKSLASYMYMFLEVGGGRGLAPPSIWRSAAARNL